MTKYTVIDEFQQVTFESYKEALKYCEDHNVSQSNIFVDERCFNPRAHEGRDSCNYNPINIDLIQAHFANGQK